MSTELQLIRDRLGGDDDAAVVAQLQRLVLDHRQEHGQHTELGLLCEQAGLMSLAMNEFQLALRDHRDDPVASFHLAQHYRERGDVARAMHLLERLLASQPGHEAWLQTYLEILIEEGAQPRATEAIARARKAGLPVPIAERLERLVSPGAVTPDSATDGKEPVGAQPWVPTDADCIRFHTLFSGREGVYARQWAKQGGEGGYSPVHEPLTPAVIRNHLLGTYTIGVYPLRLDATATFFAVDLDINKAALQRASGDHTYAQSLRQLMRSEGIRVLTVLRELGLAVLFENSGYKGRHYWCFLEEPETAATLHLLGRMLLNHFGQSIPADFHLEFFPKQAHLTGKGLGNLIKLPLGIHRRTGHRSQLLNDSGDAVADPLAALRAVVPLRRATLHKVIDRLKKNFSPHERENRGEDGAQADIGEDSHVKASATVPVTRPPRQPAWTEADFETDVRVRHILSECAVLAELKRLVDEYRQLSHEEQLVLIHSLGHLPAGPSAVNYLLAKCVDVGPEKFMGARLKGNPISCPSIRKKISHITRRVSCKCPFEFAKDRYPTPVLHELTLPELDDIAEATREAPLSQENSLRQLAQRFAVLDCRRSELQREWDTLRQTFLEALRRVPDQTIACSGGRFRLISQAGVEELDWETDDSQPLPEAETGYPSTNE